MALTVGELVGFITLDDTGMTRGARTAQRTMTQLAQDVTRIADRAATDAGNELADGITQGVRDAAAQAPGHARHGLAGLAQEAEHAARAAVATLEAAYSAAPETVAYNGYARRILLEELDAQQPARRERAAAVATRIGLLSA